MHLCGMDYKYFSPHCRKCNSFGCNAAIRCGNACRGPHSDSLYSGSEHSQFNSPRLVKREAGFPNPRRALNGSNQLWRVNDSPYYRELIHNLGQFWFIVNCMAENKLHQDVHNMFTISFMPPSVNPGSSQILNFGYCVSLICCFRNHICIRKLHWQWVASDVIDSCQAAA